MNFTTARSPNPDLEVASSNCALGRELLNLYEHDRVGQDERNALDEARANLKRAEADLLNWNRLLTGGSAYAPPRSPPPPPPPPVLENAPTAAPAIVTPEEQTRRLEDAVAFYTKDVAARSAAVSTCAPSNENTCGRSATRAPNPWLANKGQQCMGYTTYEALEGAYCAYWGSIVRLPHSNTRLATRSATPCRAQVNPDGAAADEAYELLTEDGAPYCFSESGATLKCPITAERTIRAGVYELEVRAPLPPKTITPRTSIHAPLAFIRSGCVPTGLTASRTSSSSSSSTTPRRARRSAARRLRSARRTATSRTVRSASRRAQHRIQHTSHYRLTPDCVLLADATTRSPRRWRP